jgi:hypothetical protein
MNLRWQRYRELELILDEPSRPYQCRFQTSKRTSWLRKLWNIVDITLLRDLEPQIWQSIDRKTGQTQWHIYDPATGKTQHLNSDREVRHWLEKVFQD